jgi:hypothetical protein
MPIARAANHLVTVNAYQGDAKTLLAFDLATDAARQRLAGFTIEVQPPRLPPYYLDNNLRLAPSAAHAQLNSESPFASVNAPIQKFRWVHVPGLVHQGGTPTFGTYTYVVTPRYFSERAALLPLDPSTSVAVDVEVCPFAVDGLKLGFTRGHVQSQAFVRHFGSTIEIRPASDDLLFDTGTVAGTNKHGDTFTYAQEYEWLGFTARQRIFEILDEVRDDPALTLDVFAHELAEPDICSALLELGAAGRVRIMLDDAGLRHDTGEPTPEDRFAAVFAARAGGDGLRRGEFAPHGHDTFVVVADSDGPRTVLTGSAEFSVPGLYVNSGHVLVFDDRELAAAYADAFDRLWNGQPLAESVCSAKAFNSDGTERGPANDEAHEVLHAAHTDSAVFSYGSAAAPRSIALYTPATSSGDHQATQLPAPFSAVPRSADHPVHHEFAVLGFGGSDPLVLCGSATQARADGHAPMAIRNGGVATAFVIEALILVDHYRFVDRLDREVGAAPTPPAAYADKRNVAVTAGWFLDTTGAWTDAYFDEREPHFADRELFGRRRFRRRPIHPRCARTTAESSSRSETPSLMKARYT